MINLIKAEFKKVFKKKAIYIMLIVSLGFGLLFNVIYKYMYNIDLGFGGNNYQSKEERNNLVKASKELNLNKVEELDEYISNQTEIFFYDYCMENEEWRCEVLTGDLYSYVNNYMDSMYNPKSEFDKEATKIELDKAINTLNHNTIFDIYKMRKEKAESDLADVKVLLASADNKHEKEGLINQQIDLTNDALRYQMMIDNKVTTSDSDSYLRNAINQYIEAKSSIERLDQQDKLSKEDKQEYKTYKETMSLNKYIVDHKIDDSKPSMASNLKYFFGDYSFLIIIFVIIISGGIMADEYHKGTIKQLLIKPYTRSQILSSKMIVTLLLIPIFTFILFAMYFVLTGIFTGFSGITQAIPVYDYVKEEVVVYNLFNYNLLVFVAKLPYLVIASLISFAISTITGSTALSITLPLALVFFGNIVNSIITSFKIKWLRWFITYVWDLQNYIFVRNYDSLLNSFKFSVLMIIIYLAVIIIVPYIFFNRKDIKNV